MIRLKRLCGLLLAFFTGALLATAISTTPVSAGTAENIGVKFLNTVANTAFGWTDCGKGIADEVQKAPKRFYVFTLITAPLSCGVNVAVRYGTTAVDWATMPFSPAPGLDQNLLKPAIYESWQPLVPLPDK